MVKLTHTHRWWHVFFVFFWGFACVCFKQKRHSAKKATWTLPGSGFISGVYIHDASFHSTWIVALFFIQFSTRFFCWRFFKTQHLNPTMYQHHPSSQPSQQSWLHWGDQWCQLCELLVLHLDLGCWASTNPWFPSTKETPPRSHQFFK